VERYVQIYKNVLKLLRRGFSLDEIASMLDIGRRLVEAYVDNCKGTPPDRGRRPPAPASAGYRLQLRIT
jgi:transposase